MYVQVQISNDRRSFLIRERYLIKVDPSLHLLRPEVRQSGLALVCFLLHAAILQSDRLVMTISNIRLIREYTPNSRNRDRCRLQRIPLLCNRIDRLEKLTYIRNERIKHAKLKRLAQYGPAAYKDNESN
ncbi:hypothetical protein D3C78_1145080 [compost metagenome]